MAEKKKRSLVSRVVAEMVGKQSETAFHWFSRSRNPLFTSKTTVDYTRNDYALSRSMYYGSVIDSNKDARNMILGSAFARPIINTAAAFAIGLGFTVAISIKDQDEDENASSEANAWIDTNIATIYDWVTHGYRDGDSYIYVDELGHTEEFDAKDVEIKLDTVTGEIVGFDITEVVEEDNPDTHRTTKYKIVKMFRRNSIRFDKYDEHDKFVETVFERVFTINGTITPTENQEFYEGELLDRALPIVHLANDQEPRAIYGNSEIQNVYIYMKQYHNVLDHSTRGVIYNATPIPVFKGVTNVSATEDDSNDPDAEGEDKGKLSWGQDSAIYLDGQGDAKFLQADGIMDDTSKLLNMYFNLVVEASETPEYVFGTAVQSSKASTETQTPVLLQKTERKRTKLIGVLTNLVKAYIDRQIRLSNPTFTKFKDKEIEVGITFPELATEDKKLTLEIVQFCLEQGLITEETALTLTLDDKIKDVSEELEAARKEAEESAKRNNVLPEQSSRVEGLINDELNSNTDEDLKRARQIAKSGGDTVVDEE